MGSTTSKNTRHILRSLLLLGIFEENKTFLSKQEIIEKMKDLGITSPPQVTRLLNLISIWINQKDQYSLTPRKLGRKKLYGINFDLIPDEIYLDFLDTLLSIYDIGNRPYDESVIKLKAKEGVKSLHLLSTLIYALENKTSVSIRRKDEHTSIDIKPIMLLNQDNFWWVQGKRLGLPSTSYIKIRLDEIFEISHS